MNKKSSLLLTGIFALALSSCGTDTANNNGTGAVVATVNGVPLRESLVSEQLAGLPAQLLAGREDELRQQLLSRFVDQEIAEQEADRLNVQAMDDYKKQLAAFEDQLKVNILMQHKIKEALTNEVVVGAYEKSKATMAYPAVKARHILLKTEKEAKDIIRVATPENFADLAKEKSVGPSAANGGDLGFFKKDAMVPVFADLAFATEKGKIAQTPVKTQFGWHVIYVEDKNDAFVPPFSQVEAQLRNQLTQAIITGYMQELKKNAKIDYTTVKKEEAPKPAATPDAK